MQENPIFNTVNKFQERKSQIIFFSCVDIELKTEELLKAIKHFYTSTEIDFIVIADLHGVVFGFIKSFSRELLHAAAFRGNCISHAKFLTTANEELEKEMLLICDCYRWSDKYDVILKSEKVAANAKRLPYVVGKDPEYYPGVENLCEENRLVVKKLDEEWAFNQTVLGSSPPL